MLARDARQRDQNNFGSAPPHASHVSQATSHHRNFALSNDLSENERPIDAATAKIARVDVVAPLELASQRQGLKALYTPEQRRRRDATRWTLVQGILAPLQFVVFAISAALVARYLITGEGFAVATLSIVTKTMLLYAIMITGAIWEREVFGCYLFAPAFFWEDVFSMLVLALHSAYLVALFVGSDPRQQMLIAIAAYAAYLINATQFVLKLRAARRGDNLPTPAAGSVA